MWCGGVCCVWCGVVGPCRQARQAPAGRLPPVLRSAEMEPVWSLGTYTDTTTLPQQCQKTLVTLLACVTSIYIHLPHHAGNFYPTLHLLCWTVFWKFSDHHFYTCVALFCLMVDSACTRLQFTLSDFWFIGVWLLLH